MLDVVKSIDKKKYLLVLILHLNQMNCKWVFLLLWGNTILYPTQRKGFR